MLLYSPPGDEMELPIEDDPVAGPNLAKVDFAAELFYRYGHAGRHAIFSGGQVQYLSDRTWFVIVRNTPSGQSARWVIYAIVDRPIGGGQYKVEPVSATEFAYALADSGRTVVVRKYDNYEVSYSLDGESVPL